MRALLALMSALSATGNLLDYYVQSGTLLNCNMLQKL